MIIKRWVAVSLKLTDIESRQDASEIANDLAWMCQKGVGSTLSDQGIGFCDLSVSTIPYGVNEEILEESDN